MLRQRADNWRETRGIERGTSGEPLAPMASLRIENSLSKTRNNLTAPDHLYESA
jgi:hypothetical protein